MLGHTVEEWTWIARLLGRSPPSRRPRTGARRRRRGEPHPPALLAGVPVPAGGRPVRLAPGRGGVPAARPEQEGCLAGPPVRRDRAQGGRGAAPRERARAQRHGRAPPRDRLSRAARAHRAQGHVHRPPGRADLRLHRRGVDRGRARLLGASTSTPTTSRTSLAANEVANETKEPFAQDYRFRHRDGRYLWVHDEATFVRRRRRRVVAGLHHRHHRAQGGRGAAPRGRGEVPLDRRAEPGGHLPAGVRRRDPSVSRTTYISPQQADMFGYTSEEVLADPTLWSRTVHPDDRERVLAADVESNRDGNGRFSRRVPDDQQGRPHRLGPGHRRCSCSSRGAPRSGRASCSTSPSASRPRSSSPARSRSSARRRGACARSTR